MKRFFLGAFLAGSAMLVGANAQTYPGWRSYDQQERIAQGVRSGQLTAGETARLECREARINRQIAFDRRINGGYLTRGERLNIYREQNRTSQAIWRDKHNAWIR